MLRRVITAAHQLRMLSRPIFGFSTHEQLLNQEALNLCSPLMRHIINQDTPQQSKQPRQQRQPRLQKAKEEERIREEESISEAEKEAVAEAAREADTASKHDLTNFRHMLAGPLLSQTNLDKFCLKKEKGQLLLDVKYDGERTLISYRRGEGLEMTSRNGKPQDSVYRHLHRAIFDQLEASSIQSVKYDGEIVLVEKKTEAPLSFNELQRQRRLKAEDCNLTEEEALLVYVFDVVEHNGKDLLREPLLERRKLLPQDGVFRKAEHRIVRFPEERAKVLEYFREVLSRKYEGLIIKGCFDAYFTNESRTHWKKLKRGFTASRDASIAKVDLDLVVMGANRGQGSKNSRLFTSYLLGTPYQGKILPVSNVGSGLTTEMLEVVAAHVEQQKLAVTTAPEEYALGNVRTDVYYKPALVFEVQAQELIHSPLYNLGRGEFGGLTLRFPVFRGIRPDKGPKEATTGEQILELAKAFHFGFP